MTIKINIYRAGGEWCYAAFDGDEYDHSDAIGVTDEVSEDEARAEMSRQFPEAAIERVADVTADGQPA